MKAKGESDREYARWQERLKAATELRRTEETRVWQKLHDLWQGPLQRGQDSEALVNPLREYMDVLLPHLVGESRQVRVVPLRVRADEEAEEKLGFAEMLGDQATALGKAIGLLRDEQGRPGEMVRAIRNSFWSMGILLFGFEVGGEEGNKATRQRGNKPEDAEERGESRDLPVDLDFAKADHRELHDAGMPFARCIDARDFLGDPSFKDFSRGQWCAIEYYLTVGEAEARFPRFKGQFHGTHTSPAVWDDGDDSGADGGQRPRLIRLLDIYQRRPRLVLTVADERGGPREVLEKREYELGLEGLPVLLLGHEWVEREPYPLPLLEKLYHSAKAENEHLLAVHQAGLQIKEQIMVDEGRFEGGAQKLRDAEDNGVHAVDGDPKGIIDSIEVGGLRKEHLELAERNREASERAGGTSDFMLGRREPGDATVGVTEMRQANISMRLAGKVDPVRSFEAETYRRLIAVAYAKILLLHGVQLPVDEQIFVAFDATAPVVGELVDYGFEVEVASRLTSADEINQINNLLQLLPNYVELLAAEGRQIRFAPLLEQVLEKSRVRGKNEILVEMAPQPEPGAEPQGAGIDPGAELAAVWEELGQLGEGDPREEELLRHAAGLQAQVEQMQGGGQPVAA